MTISMYGPQLTNPHAYINGVDVAECIGGTWGSGLIQASCTFIVPKGNSYSLINTVPGSPSTINNWAELR